ncbi:MAG: hypothetical protein ACERKO_03710 [Acetanaerobacterium sp.]
MKNGKLTSIILSLAMLASIFSGCASDASNAPGSNDGTDGGAAASNAEGDGLVISMVVPYFAYNPPPDDHIFWQWALEDTGATFDMTWVPQAAFKERVNLLLASSDMPMVINGKLETRQPNMIDAQRAGAFWEITDDMISQLPQFFSTKMDQKVLDVLGVDGHLYCLPEERAVGRAGMIFRQDWLDKLGLDVPRTVDDFDKVIRAFGAQQIPGTPKTYGLFLNKDYLFPDLTALSMGYGGPHTWLVEDGKFTPEFSTPEYMQALDLMRSWFADGLVNPDFVTLNSSQDFWDAFVAQKSGLVMCDSLDAAMQQSAVLDLDPNAVVGVSSYMIDNNGNKYINGGTGHSGGFFFTKSGIPDEKTLMDVLTVFDKLADPDGRFLKAYYWGTEEGKHYDIIDGKISQTDEQRALSMSEHLNLIQVIASWDNRLDFDNADISDLQRDIVNGWKENSECAVMNPALPLISDTYVEKGVELDNMWKDAVSKYVMGELDQNSFKVAIQDWYDQGGTKIIEEFEAAYKLTNN